MSVATSAVESKFLPREAEKKLGSAGQKSGHQNDDDDDKGEGEGGVRTRIQSLFLLQTVNISP